MSQVVENLLDKNLPIQPPQHNTLALAYALRMCRKATRPEDYAHIIANLLDEIDNLSAMSKTIAMALAEAKRSARQLDQLAKHPQHQVQAA